MDTSFTFNFNSDLIVVEVDPAVPQAAIPAQLDAASLSMSADSLSGGSPTIKPGMSYNQMLQPPPYAGSRGQGFTPVKVRDYVLFNYHDCLMIAHITLCCLCDCVSGGGGAGAGFSMVQPFPAAPD